MVTEVSNNKRSRSQVTLVLFLFFMSGTLALTYQVVWSRMMMNIFGSTAVAVGTVLAAFMTGLAIGAWKIGKIADSHRNCLRLYAFLEAGIALAALSSHLLLGQMNAVHASLFELFGFSEVVFGMVRFAMAFLLVVVPTLFMGATLPVLTRFLFDRNEKAGVNLSTLYAVNTFGAVAGVMLTGFFLIGRYGIHVPVYLALAGNLLIGVIAWLASGRMIQASPAATTGTAESESISQGMENPPGAALVRLILFGLCLSGFTSFAYEIYWTRSLVFILGNSTYALTTMLSSFLTGIALGGYIIRFLLRRVSDATVIFGWVQVLLGITSAMALPFLFSIADPQSLSQYVLKSSASILPLVFSGFGLAFLVMLVPAMLIGMTFPLAGQIGIHDPEKSGSSTGRIYAINTFGNVLGALLPGFFLINWLGIQKGILLMASLNALLGFTILFLRLVPRGRHPAWRVIVAASLVLTVYSFSRAPLGFQFPSEGEYSDYRTLYYREGPSATTKVFQDPSGKQKHMSVDGIVIGGTGMPEFKQLLLAHLPKLLLEDVSNELSVGVGSGILMGESLRHAGVRNITGVEIEPGVVEGARLFAAENHEVLDNPDARIVVDDIGNFLRTTSHTYQVITADEKTADEYASNGFSYSREYYELLRQHLAPGGLVAQWIPTTLPAEQYQMVLKTFADSFPHVQLWYFLPSYQPGPLNSILIGSHERIDVSYEHIKARFADSGDAFESLAIYGLTSAESLLPHYIADENTIRQAVGSALTNSLEHPRYEFYYPWDYAAVKESMFVDIHRFIIQLKRDAYPDFLAELEREVTDSGLLKTTFSAELLYLMGFEAYLSGMTTMQMEQMFNYVLSVAPWNDSLRARVYSLYAYTASQQRNPVERARLMKRAADLYVSPASP